MAFQRFFKQPVKKDPETVKREALVTDVITMLNNYDPRNMLASVYLNDIRNIPAFFSDLPAFVEDFMGSPAEKDVLKSVAHLNSSTAEEMTQRLAIVCMALVQSGVIQKRHVSDRSVDRKTLVSFIMGRLIDNCAELDDVARKNLKALVAQEQTAFNIAQGLEVTDEMPEIMVPRRVGVAVTA